jgi:signal transduction histidine kinase
LLAFATEMFAAAAVELAADPDHLRRLIEGVEDVTAAPRVILGREFLRVSALLQLPVAVAIEVQLVLLQVLAGARSVSMWSIGPDDGLKRLGQTGKIDRMGASARQLAARILRREVESADRTSAIAGVLVERWQQPGAALIVTGKTAAGSQRVALLQAAVPLLSSMLERDDLGSGTSRSDRAAIAAAERRLARVRFDLHDGPQQDVLLLSQDLELFRDQLSRVLADHSQRLRALGRLEDLRARLVALDGDLHRISVAVESPFLHAEPLAGALARLADEFAGRTGVEPELNLRGNLTDLTDSQQIALLGLIREALSNTREHSGATSVEIKLTAGASGIDATVTDNGRGFDPETTLVQAARDGHLGLVGMHERMRLLGGHTRIDSRPGGPTVIAISLPSMKHLIAARPR